MLRTRNSWKSDLKVAESNNAQKPFDGWKNNKAETVGYICTLARDFAHAACLGIIHTFLHTSDDILRIKRIDNKGLLRQLRSALSLALGSIVW